MTMVQPSRRALSRLVAVLCFLCAAILPARAEERFALVVGNSLYRNVPALANPSNDARLIARALEDSGFTLIGGGPQLDVTRTQFEALIREFGRRLTADSTALFYFAGHAVQIGGKNYLIPVEANVATANDVKYELVDADFVLEEMTSAGSRVNLVLLDACRNNPFSGRGLRGITAGLAPVIAPTGTIIGYATQPGAVAADGDGADSPYSTALARAISTPGTPVLEALNRVGLEVQAATGGRQSPWLALSPLRGSFYFRPPSAPGSSLQAPDVSPAPTPVDQPSIRTPGPAPVLSATPSPSAEVRTMDVCPADYEGFPPDGAKLSCGCTPEASTPGRASVFGDLVYAGHSSLCLAARHAGVISGRGGQIVIWPAPTPDEDPPFPSVLRNGIQSSGGAPLGTSFRVSALGGEPAPLPPPSSPGMRVMEFCPDNYHEFPTDGPALTCGCTAEASTPGRASVFGDKVYAGNSSLCLAARHAGVITGRGGKIVVTPVPAPDADPPFPSVLRNGIQSYGSAPLGPSFRVSSANPAADPPARPSQPPIAETLRAQGRVQVYINFDTDKASLQPSAEPVLRELLAALNSRPELRVDLIGHTDAVGSAAHNQDLSTRRAATVLTWLVQHGIVPSRLQSSGRGSTEPIADNTSELGRALNRRVEVKALN
jgi:outer membrane protein OmpA-like peptidoglycan-associated protein